LAADYPPYKRVHLERLTNSQLVEIATQRFNSLIVVRDNDREEMLVL